MPKTGTNLKARSIVLAIMAGTAYWTIAELSLHLAVFDSHSSPFWPPSGIAVAGLLLFGRQWWPVLLLSAFAISIPDIIDAPTHLERVPRVIAAISVAIGNTLEALCGSLLITRFANGSSCFQTSRDTTRFIILGGFVSPIFSMCFGIGSLTALGLMPKEIANEAALTWYLANAAGILTFSPAIILCSGKYSQNLGPKRLFEFLILCTITTIISCTTPNFASSEQTFHFTPQSYLVLPLLLYISFRFRHFGATTTILIASLATVIFTQDDIYPPKDLNYSILHIQLFVGVIATTCLSLVAVLTELDLANSELAKDVDDRSNRIREILLEKDEMMAAAAHDLQAPLVSMRNVLALLQAQRPQKKDDLNSRLINDIKSTCGDLISLVSRMLDAHRVETIAERIKIEPIDISVIIHDVIDRRTRALSLKDIQLKKIGFEKPAIVETDFDCLSRVTANLLDNAITYVPEGGLIEIKISRLRNHQVEISIFNEGPAIPKEQQSNLFTKFSRFRLSSPSDKESHGFGLYIVKKLLDSSGGSIKFIPTPKGGCQFNISFSSPSN